MSNVPTYLTPEQFLSVLDEIRARVASGDSFEGSLEYRLPDEEDPDEGFRVQAVFRVGNSGGQGGMKMVGEPATTKLQGKTER